MSARSRKKDEGSLRIAVIGAGVIGLACALELKRRGADVTVYEGGSELSAGVTTRAAGMLSAAFEWVREDQRALAALAKGAGEMWPEFAARLGSVEFSGEGALVAVRSAAELAWIEEIAAACQARELPAVRLSASELRRLEPALTGEFAGGLLLPEDRQVDAELVLRALGAALEKAGVGLRLGQQVGRVVTGDGFGLADGERYDRLVLATGAGAPPLFVDQRRKVQRTGLPEIVPVKGQMLALARTPGAPRHVIHTPDVYIAPKSRWILVGATIERGRSDTVVDQGAISELRARAAAVVDVLGAAPEAGAWAGVRPGTPDDAPLIGETLIPGVFAAMGHYRNGVLFAPATAAIVAEQVIDGKVSARNSDLARPFDARRFDKHATAAHSRSAEG